MIATLHLICTRGPELAPCAVLIQRPKSRKRVKNGESVTLFASEAPHTDDRFRAVDCIEGSGLGTTIEMLMARP